MDSWRHLQPAGIPFNRPPPMFPYQRPPNVLLPTPPRPDTPESIISNWEKEILPSFRQRRGLIDSKKRISLTDFKKKLARWKTLLEHPDSSNFVGELQRLQQECTDSEALHFVRRKIERTNRRRQTRNESSTLLPTSVGELLSHLDQIDTPVPTAVPQPDPSKVIAIDLQNVNEMPMETCLENLKKASKICQNTTRVLGKLDQLRSIRINQLRRSQGKPLLEETDSIFEKKKTSIMNELEITQKNINKLIIQLKNTQSQLIGEIGQSGVTNDDEIPHEGLPPGVNYVLFGSRDLTKNTRWSRFYSQSNRNFSDFVQIRSNWDKYMVPSNSIHPPGPSELKRHSPSLLPITWELPPSPCSDL